MLFWHIQTSDILQSRGFGHAVRWTIVLALWTLLISMAIGKFGISNYLALRENADILKENNLELSIKNQMLADEINTLKRSASARHIFLAREIGLVQKSEIVLHLQSVKFHPAELLTSNTPSQKATRFAKNENGGF